MTTVVLQPGQLPSRLQALGWKRPVYLRGAPLADGPAVAIVGARAASGVGMARAHAIAKHLGERGVQIVSGGALGIDGAAHRGALAGGGRTTVVLGCGVDVAYPKRHAPLFREVLARGGSVVGIMADGSAPRPGSFPARNPLIAALADCVIVVEADVRSGSLSTARAGKQQGRLVAAWPGTRGCDQLLFGGAAIIETAGDAEQLLAGCPRYPVRAPLDPIAQQLADALAQGARSVDDLVRITRLPVYTVLRTLPALERMK